MADAMDAAPVEPESVVDAVTVRGAGPDTILARVQRGDTAYGVRSQLVAAGFATENDIRSASTGHDACVEATAGEVAALKALPEGPAKQAARSARAMLVPMAWLAARFSKPLSLAALARFSFCGAVPLPSRLPDGETESEEDADDADFDEHTEPEQLGALAWI